MSTYWVHAVIGDVGWISDKEEADIRSILDEDSVVHLMKDHHLNMDWPVTADTLNGAITTAQATMNRAVAATGVICPRARLFEVREVGH